MSFANPTPLRIGMTGNLGGHRFKVIGRSVLGVTDDGETYYWNEYNLESTDGKKATLVFEQTDRGNEWRLFTQFDPEHPMTAAEARTKRIGERLNLDGTDVRVTLKDRSRVYFIEGRGPDDEDVGDVAEYFNAEAGDVMQVVSWTGDEVEYYHGFTLSRGSVKTAFNLPSEAGMMPVSTPASTSSWTSSDSGSDDSSNWSGAALKIFVVFVILIMVVSNHFSCSSLYYASSVKRIPAGKAPLMTGARGAIHGTQYHIVAHAVVEIEEQPVIFQRHEYDLVDTNGFRALLVCGINPGDSRWMLFEPQQPLFPPNPQQAAAQKLGETLDFNGLIVTITELFRSTLRQVDSVEASDWHMNDVSYGYSASSGQALYLVRWNANAISFLHGTSVDAPTVTAAFAN